MQSKILTLVFVVLVGNIVLVDCVSDVLKYLTKYKKCFHQKQPLVCLKEKVLVALNETILDDRPIVIGFVEILKNPGYFEDNTIGNGNVSQNASHFPIEASERGLNLGNGLLDRIEEFFKSRTIKFNLSNAFEGM